MRGKLILKFLLPALSGFPLTVLCQDKEIPSFIDLTTAFSIARQNYPSIKAKVAEKGAYDYELKAVRQNYLPDFIIQGQILNATSNTVRGMFFPNEGSAIPVSGGIKVAGFTNDAVWTSFATGLVNWKFFNFGKFRSAVDAAKAGAVTAEADYQNEVFQQQIKVGDAYFLLLMANDMRKSQRANLARVKALKDVTSAYAKSGLKPGVDSSLVNAEYSKATLQYLEAKRIASEQEVYLKELMGLTSEVGFSLDTAIYLDKVPLPADAETEFRSNPRLIYFKSIVLQNEARVTSIRRSAYPSISLLASSWGRGSGISNTPLSDGSFQYNKSFSSGVGFRAYDWMLGVSTIWNFTSLFRTGSLSREQRQVTTMAQERYNEETLRVEGELQRARLRYAAAVESSRQAPIQLKAARDAYGQAKARYDAGFNSILELTQTFALLNRAEVDLSVAKGNVWRAVIQLAAATGNIEIINRNLN